MHAHRMHTHRTCTRCISATTTTPGSLQVGVGRDSHSETLHPKPLFLPHPCHESSEQACTCAAARLQGAWLLTTTTDAHQELPTSVMASTLAPSLRIPDQYKQPCCRQKQHRIPFLTEQQKRRKGWTTRHKRQVPDRNSYRVLEGSSSTPVYNIRQEAQPWL